MHIDPFAQATNHYSSSHHGQVRKAQMTSPEFPSARNYCLRFWYTMYGNDIGTVNVYAQVMLVCLYSVLCHVKK